MKKLFIFIAVFVSVFLCSCGHNVSQMEFGKLFSAGSPEYGKLKYMEGFAVTQVGKENTRIKLDVDSTTGVVLDPVSGNLKGIQSIEIETGPQLTGYIKDANPETAKAYYEAVAGYYAKRTETTAKVSESKSNTATTSVSDWLKKLISKDGSEATKAEGLCKDDSISAQKVIVEKLKACYGLPTDMKNVTDLEKRLETLETHGQTKTIVCVDAYEVEGSILKSVKFVFYEGGVWKETDCVSCISLEIDVEDEE